MEGEVTHVAILIGLTREIAGAKTTERENKSR